MIAVRADKAGPRHRLSGTGGIEAHLRGQDREPGTFRAGRVSQPLVAATITLARKSIHGYAGWCNEWLFDKLVN